ncbi:MAG: hypothetical protein HN411_05015 [Waddliaceae bacterium]|jgi:hypothetical protein|nr:hypothetical protein [Waddliaceae bacterium]MBT3579087.1 hypothetical protein [Waddliaceae bacterium]MBT4444798.1 hypothetical protein [Waddliaceae bacterium]MBT6928067.1 hypothetical protein [Waddliaceae bacterium]MBT7264451.1 hypothetical protein [Waddliaceae bacterium]
MEKEIVEEKIETPELNKTETTVAVEEQQTPVIDDKAADITAEEAIAEEVIALPEDVSAENLHAVEEPQASEEQQPTEEPKPPEAIEKTADKTIKLDIPIPAIVVIEEKPKREKKEKKKKEGPLSLTKLSSTIDAEKDASGKIERIIDFLKETLTHREGPFFKEFWEGRRMALAIFGEEMKIDVRTAKWEELDRLSREASSLKDIEDEQSSFAAEQIDIALCAVEKGIKDIDSQVEKAQRHVIDIKAPQLKNNIDVYETIQGKLTIYNAYSERINSLRKELIKVEIKIRAKNKLFKRLSAAGDNIFPQRKELVKTLSSQFIADVDAFIERNFSEDGVKGKIYGLRDDIKALQSLAKTLTLNTNAFTSTRKKLSKCWDAIKDIDKERRKERNDKREEYKENYKSVLEKITAFEEKYGTGEMSGRDAIKTLNDITVDMRAITLAYDHVKKLKEKVAKARKIITDKERAEEDKHRAKAEEKRKIQDEQKEKIRAAVEAFVDTAREHDVDTIISEKETLRKKVQESVLTKAEKITMERRLRAVDDEIIRKKDEALLALSDDDRDALDTLTQALAEKKGKLRTMKEKLEEHFKIKASSGMDFDKALTYNELIKEEKERIDDIENTITKVEKKIADVKKKVEK